MPVLNFTQHRCTADQLAAGIIDCPEQFRDQLTSLLTFDELPTSSEVWNRAQQLAHLFETVAVHLGFDYATKETSLHAMIGGAPFLMPLLEDAFDDIDVTAYYAFSRRESVDQVQEDGTVRKVAVFKHVGLYEVA
jgi:hypothetical protein